MKHLLFAGYIFSVLYCYLETNSIINKTLQRFTEKHPNLPISETSPLKRFQIDIEILLISMVPVINIFLGLVFSCAQDGLIDEVVGNIEANHWSEIRELESDVEDIESEMKE